MLTFSRSPAKGMRSLRTASATSRETKRPNVSLTRSRSCRPPTISLNERARKPSSSCRSRRARKRRLPRNTSRMPATSFLTGPTMLSAKSMPTSSAPARATSPMALIRHCRACSGVSALSYDPWINA